MQKSLFAAGVLTLGILSPAIATCQSLADVARAEEARRKTTKKPSKVYTNDDLGRASAAPPPAAVPAATQPAAATAGTPVSSAASKPAPGPKQGETAQASGKDEKYWRDRITSARSALQRSQAFLDALQSHINGLATEFVNMGDPIQRAAIEQKRLGAIAEQERVRADIVQQSKAIASIEDDARRAAVPPGWLR